MNIDQLLEFDRLARKDGEKYNKRRKLYESIANDSGPHFIGIVGPRGAGKTIILKQLALANKGSFYISLDTMDGDLFDIVKALNETMKIELFLLDEVHVYSRFEADLKKLYDALNIKVVFTSSTALGMHESVYDLSRRVILKMLYPFSLREYVWFKYGQEFSNLILQDIIEARVAPDFFRAGEHFKPYIRGGLMPFALQEPQPLLILENILKTIIYKDIPHIARLLTDELDKINRLVRFIGLSGIDGINYSSIAQNMHITKYKAEQYVTLLEKAFVLHRVFPIGSNVMKEPKIVMALPYRLLYKQFDEAIGGLREDFFVEAFKALGKEISYLKSTRGEKTPDYVIRDLEDVVFEIGGKNKGRSQFKGVDIKTKIIFADDYSVNSKKQPLFLAGMLTG
jgi:uncharacterized protein